VNHTDVVDIALLRAMVMKCGEEEGLYVLITWFVDHHPLNTPCFLSMGLQISKWPPYPSYKPKILNVWFA